MLRTKIKASSLTSLTDARYFAAYEVEWLGFNLEPGHERFVPPAFIQAVREWVDGVKIVGEFNFQTAEEILAAVRVLPLDAVQVGPFTDLDALIELNRSLPVIKEIILEVNTRLDDLLEEMETFTPCTQFFLLNLDKNGLDWDALKAGRYSLDLPALRSICEQFPVLLSIELEAAMLPELLSALPIQGLNLTGGEEEKVGFKSFDELDEVLEALALDE